MQSIKQFLLFYIVGIIIVLINGILVGNNTSDIVTSPGLYISPAIFCAVGFFCSLIFFELNLRPANKKRKIFFFGYCLATLALLTISIISSINRLKEINHKKQFGNVESNHKVMKTWVNDNEEYIRIAFDRLEKEFKNPNDFNLDAFSVRKRDTIINEIQDTIYNLYFVYFLTPDNRTRYFSKVSVLMSRPELKIFNADTKTNEEYKIIKAEKEQMEREVMEELRKVASGDTSRGNTP